MTRPPITHVAIRFEGKVWSLPAPNRHHDVIRMIFEANGQRYVNSHGEDQGFLDESGRYLNRKQALASAVVNNQVKDRSKITSVGLTSEDVW